MVSVEIGYGSNMSRFEKRVPVSDIISNESTAYNFFLMIQKKKRHFTNNLQLRDFVKSISLTSNMYCRGVIENVASNECEKNVAINYVSLTFRQLRHQ